MGAFNNKETWTDQTAQQLALTIPGAELLGNTIPGAELLGSWGKATLELCHVS